MKNRNPLSLYYATVFSWQLAPMCTSVKVAMEIPILDQLYLRKISSLAGCGKTDTEIKAEPALQRGVRQVCWTRLEVGQKREGGCLHKCLINTLRPLLFFSIILLSSPAVL